MKHTRRGSAYLLVLGASMMIVTVGVSAVLVAKQSTSGAIARSDALSAEAGAIAGITMGLESADPAPSWRESHDASPRCVDAQIDRASIQVFVTDPTDAVLDDNWAEPICLRAVSTAGVGSRTYRAIFDPVIHEVEALDHAMSVGGNLLIISSFVDAIGSVAVGGFLRVQSPDAQATHWLSVDGAQGLAISQNLTRINAAVRHPNEDAIETLAAKATTLPTSECANIVLSEGVNPWGRPSPNGLYVIDCRGSGAVVRNSRIRGTILFLNADRGVRIDGSVAIESANPAYPSLIIDGPCEFAMSRQDLSESEVGMNFNPTGAPFDGKSDNDRRDSYGSMISGTVWVRGDARIRGEGFTCDGSLIVDGDVVADSPLVLRHVAMKTEVRGFAVRDRWRQREGSFARVTE